MSVKRVLKKYMVKILTWETDTILHLHVSGSGVLMFIDEGSLLK